MIKDLEDFLEECKFFLPISCILQFGSSTYSKNPRDIDLVLFFNEKFASTKSILKLIAIIKKFESKNRDLVFDFSGLDRKRKGKYKITIVLIGKLETNVKYNPHDIFFFKNLIEDKNKKVLYGKLPIKKEELHMDKQHLFEMLSVDQKHALRKSLDDNEYKLESANFLFKTFLRGMLINKGVFKKEELLSKFKKEFGDKINLPKRSEEILSYKLKSRDFESVLLFSEDCLNYLCT